MALNTKFLTLPPAGFMPRLCQPYRARTKGKVERFVGYLKGSFWVPFVASMRQLGLAADMHATTGEVPAARLLIERTRLQRLPAAYGGRSARSRHTDGVRKVVLGYQHPLAVYDTLLMDTAA